MIISFVEVDRENAECSLSSNCSDNSSVCAFIRQLSKLRVSTYTRLPLTAINVPRVGLVLVPTLIWLDNIFRRLCVRVYMYIRDLYLYLYLYIYIFIFIYIYIFRQINMLKWFGQSTSGYESIDNGDTGGKLKEHVIGAINPSLRKTKDYFTGIPYYIGNTIPTELRRTITFMPNDYNYLYFSDFLYYLHTYGEENTWIVAGLLSLTLISEPGGTFKAGLRTTREGNLNKQIICKRVGTTVVCIINVTDSEKRYGEESLHHLFQDKILKIDYPTSTAAGSPPVVKVYGTDGTQDTNIVDPPTMGTPNPKPTQLTVSGLEKILAPKRAIVVADPNQVSNKETTIVGFGDKTISEINDIVKRIMIIQQEEAAAAAAAAAAEAAASEAAASALVSGPEVPSGGNRMKKTKSKLKKRRRSRRYRPKTTRKLKKKAHKHSRRRSVRSCYKK